jgi:hypothetical protein
VKTSAPRTFGVPGLVLDLAAGPDDIWALTGAKGVGSNSLAVIPGQVLQLAPETGQVLRAIELPPGDDVGWFSLNRLALGRTVL